MSMSDQAHLLVSPNSALGLGVFGALFALGTVIIFRGVLPRVVWWGMSAGTLAGLVFVNYFLAQSVLVFRTLCPYCMLTWAAGLGVLPVVLGAGATVGAFGDFAKPWGR